mmetsp:Transcript_20459/g.28342  ORF Transcript_20459/g.28342 Transcript_20459/m.28342 type:complete len:220 (+) Transcript_20459:326-985(+)
MQNRLIISCILLLLLCTGSGAVSSLGKNYAHKVDSEMFRGDPVGTHVGPVQQVLQVPRQAQRLHHRIQLQPHPTNLSPAVIQFVSQGSSSAAGELARRFDFSHAEQHQLERALSFKKAYDETRKYLRGRARKYERRYRAPASGVDAGLLKLHREHEDSDVDRDGVDQKIKWNKRGRWNIGKWYKEHGFEHDKNWYHPTDDDANIMESWHRHSINHGNHQ